jgi:hypothetical protein
MNQVHHIETGGALWAPALLARGFVSANQGFNWNGVTAVANDQWLILSMDAPAGKPEQLEASHESQAGPLRRSDRTRGSLGDERASAVGAEALRPVGLWKPAQTGSDTRFLFELPTLVIEHETNECPEWLASGSSAFVAWAQASSQGEPPPGWHPPGRSLVESWLPREGLTVQKGPTLRQGDLILGPTQWGLRFPVLYALPPELPVVRRDCLAALAHDAQQHWRMARVGVERGAEGEALLAGIDLWGAPHSEALFLASLQVLKEAVLWVVETAELLADTTVTWQSLEGCGLLTQKNRKETA